MRRRGFLTGALAASLPQVAGAHTLYNQWVVYRRKHLHIGCHKEDPPTFGLAHTVAAVINHVVPKAAARVARAPYPGRLASLLATDQLDVVILSWTDAAALAKGEGTFAPYGAVPIRTLSGFGPGHVVAAHRAFPDHHSWLLAAALAEIEPI
ncbi:MAG: hypothetical protein AAFQ66_07005, partial [Pseudomonadota bacterium]